MVVARKQPEPILPATDVEIPQQPDIKPKGEVNVQTTLTYKANADETEKADTKSNNETPREFAARIQNQNAHSQREDQREIERGAPLPKNQLADLFQELKDEQDFEGETFYALITRRQDLMNDSFKVPCGISQDFPPFQITANSMLQFIPTIQKYNGNSGGRFNVRITDEKGEDLEIGIAGYVIANPIIEDRPLLNESNGDSNNMLAIMERMQEKSDERFERMLSQMKPQEDEFTKLAKEKMRNDILNPPERKDGFNADEFIAKIFGADMMIRTISEKMSSSFKGSSAEKDESMVKFLLTNEPFLEKANDVAEKALAVFNNIMVTRGQPPINQTQNPPLPQQSQPPIPTPEQEQENNMEREKIINEIIAELESENKLDADNEFMKKLATENAELYNGLLMLSKNLPFNVLLDQLEQAVPDTFDQFYKEKTDENADDEFNERGEKLEARLKELYEYLKGLE
jgi:hypothetical protein